jgi:hypothetical protein
MQELFTAIKATINSTSALSSLVGKVFAGEIDPKTVMPYARVSMVVASKTTGTYGIPNMLESYPIQFSVWAIGLTAASNLLDAFIAAFNETNITTSSGTLVRNRMTGRGFMSEGLDADSNQVFQCFATFEFCMQNS